MYDTLEEFNRAAKEKSSSQTCFIDMEEEGSNLIYYSCVPWLDMTAVTNERDLVDENAKDESIPHITWGKYVERNGRKELGISMEVNHRLIDGYHLGLFGQKLTEEIKALICNQENY